MGIVRIMLPVSEIPNPKNWPVNLNKAKAIAKTARPIKALMILFLAFPTASFSPAEVIHSKAPKISITKTNTKAIKKAIASILEIASPRVLNPCVGGVMSIFAANDWIGINREAIAEVINANFFICSLTISISQTACQVRIYFDSHKVVRFWPANQAGVPEITFVAEHRTSITLPCLSLTTVIFCPLKN